MIMVKQKVLDNLKEESKIKVNNLDLNVLRVDSEIEVDCSQAPKNIEVKEKGKSLFLSDEDGNEYFLYLSLVGNNLVLKRIKRRHISTPWEYDVLEEIEVKSIDFGEIIV